MVLLLNLALCVILGASGLRPPPPPPPADEEVEAFVRSMREAVTNLRTIRYTCSAVMRRGEAVLIESDATVAAARADAGGWRIASLGDHRGSPAEAFKAVCDSITARSFRAADSAVRELSADNLHEFILFFTAERAAHPVMWEMLDDPPYSRWTEISIGPAVKFRGETCRTVLATSPDGARITVFVGEKDRLPRRMHREIASPPNGPALERTIELATLKVNEPLPGADFELAIPPGAIVRNQKRMEDAASRSAWGDLEPGTEIKPAPTQAAKPKAKPAEKPLRPTPALIAEGTMAPAFSLTDTAGATVTLEGLRGKVVLLDFWATWCGPCRVSMPGLQRLANKFANDDLVVLGLQTFDEADAAAYMKKNNLTYGVLVGADAVAGEYGVTGIPAIVIIDRAGKVVHAHVGGSKTIDALLEPHVVDALAGK